MKSRCLVSHTLEGTMVIFIFLRRKIHVFLVDNNVDCTCLSIINFGNALRDNTFQNGLINIIFLIRVDGAIRLVFLVHRKLLPCKVLNIRVLVKLETVSVVMIENC